MEIGKKELRKIILHKQGLTNPSYDPLEICSKLNGFQAKHGNDLVEQAFAIRTEKKKFSEQSWREELVRCWSLRGTLHVFPKKDLPLYLHQGRSIGQRDVDDIRADIYLHEEDKRYFADLILNSLKEKPRSRDELKEIASEAGLQQEAERSVFNPWGGLIRYLAETGKLYQQYGQDGKYVYLDNFQPQAKNEAELEIIRRYFENYGPSSIDDARYFFRRRKRDIVELMEQLDLKTVTVGGKERFYLKDEDGPLTLPDLLLLPSFDPLLIGYEKTENPFLSADYLREIYTYSGLVRPCILVGDRIIGSWSMEMGKAKMNIFAKLTKMDVARIQHFLQNLEQQQLD